MESRKIPMIFTIIPLTIALAGLALCCTPTAVRIGALWQLFVFAVIAMAVYSFTYQFYVTKRFTYRRYVLFFITCNITLYSCFLLISWFLLMLSTVDWT